MNMNTFSTNFNSIAYQIDEIDAKIAEAKTYLKKLRQYRRLLVKVQAELDAVADAEKLVASGATVTPSLDIASLDDDLDRKIDSLTEVDCAPVNGMVDDPVPAAEVVETEGANTETCVAVTPEVVDDEVPLSQQLRETFDVANANYAQLLDIATNVVNDYQDDLRSKYEAMGIRALRLLCRDRGIKGAARMTKAQCIAALIG